MRYSTEPRDRIYVKGYGFLSFAKNMGKSLSNKYGQKLLDSAKKSTTDAIKTASKRAIQKTAEATGDLIGNKIADKITSVLKKMSGKMMTLIVKQKQVEAVRRTHQRRDTYHQKKDSKLLMNQGQYQKKMYIFKNYS